MACHDAVANLNEKYPGWALVTGASSGIGRAFASALAAGGMNCVLVSNEQIALDETAAELRRRQGIEAIPCCVDLSEPDAIAAIRRCVGQRNISFLVNNASYGLLGDFLGHPIQDYQRLIGVNVNAYLALTHEFLPSMTRLGRAAVIFVSSLNSLTPIGRSAVYTASKAFELYLGGSLWYEMRGTGVDVLVVLPGPTRTGFQRKAGTKTATWAITPEEVVDQALPALGRKLLFIPDLKNNLFVGVLSGLSMERKVMTASRLLDATLIRGEEQNAGPVPQPQGESLGMNHVEFLQSLCLQVQAYAKFHAAVQRMEPTFTRAFLMDPLSRAIGEEFGSPVVEWFDFASSIRGVRVGDGTLVFEHDESLHGAVYFLRGVRARSQADLPRQWRAAAEVAAVLEGDPVFEIVPGSAGDSPAQPQNAYLIYSKAAAGESPALPGRPVHRAALGSTS